MEYLFQVRRILLKNWKGNLVKMSLNCNHSGSNGTLPTNFKVKKSKDQVHGSGGVWKLNGKIPMLVLVVFVGLIWVFSGLNGTHLNLHNNKSFLFGDFKNLLFWGHVNFGQHQLQTFSDQVISFFVVCFCVNLLFFLFVLPEMWLFLMIEIGYSYNLIEPSGSM